MYNLEHLVTYKYKYTLTLVHTRVHTRIQIHQYKYTVPKITQFTQIKYNHPSKRGYPEKGENTRLKITKDSEKSQNTENTRMCMGHTHNHHERECFICREKIEID